MQGSADQVLRDSPFARLTMSPGISMATAGESLGHLDEMGQRSQCIHFPQIQASF